MPTKTERPSLTTINLLAAERAAHDSLYQIHVDIVDGMLKDPELREVVERTSLELFEAMAQALRRDFEARAKRKDEGKGKK